MLALFPGLETQYEKAVWDALERAGVFDWRIHNADMYGELADDLVPAVRPGDEVFFADDVEATYEQVYEMGYTRG